MKNKIKFLIIILLLITLPTSAIQWPQHVESFLVKKDLIDIYSWNYDEILALIDDIESGELENNCNLQELENIIPFIAFLAKQGIFSDASAGDLELDVDIQELFDNESKLYKNYFYIQHNYKLGMIPAFSMKSSGHKLCKTWIKKRWKHLKKFAKKHKAALIIGTAVAVATVAVVFVVAAASTAAVASVTGLMTEGIDTKLPPHAIQNDSMGTEITSNDKLILSHNESSILQTAIEEHVTTFKETISKDCLGVIENESKGHEDAALGEKARNLGSTLAHEALDGIAQLAVCVPELLEEIKEIGKHILPNTLLLEGNEITPKQKFNNVVGRGHEKIDQIFSTERSILYSPEAKDARNQCDLGMIPFSALVEAQFAAAGQVLDRGGFTKAGRSLMKHGYREGSVFPKPTGNAAQINEHAQQILESILNHPEKVIFERPHPDFGKIIDIKIPNKGGVRFSIDGNMIGFLEP